MKGRCIIEEALRVLCCCRLVRNNEIIIRQRGCYYKKRTKLNSEFEGSGKGTYSIGDEINQTLHIATGGVEKDVTSYGLYASQKFRY